MSAYVRTVITPLETVTLTAEMMPASLPEAYARVKAVVEKDSGYGAAWKVGGSTPPAQKALGIDEIFFAPMHEKEIVAADKLVPGFKTLSITSEGEIALRISAKAESYLEKGMDAVAAAPLADLFDVWCVSSEMPSGALTNGGDFGVPAIVSDRCGSGCLVLGPEHAYTADTKWNGEVMKTEQNGTVIAEGTTSDLVGPADEVARDFIVVAMKYGFRPKAGQWVSTGGIIPCKPLEENADIKIYYDGKVELAFKTGYDAA
ncbi:hypothetical protein [uncultured Cohaesibacter sp.]|uniref:hypothetical protein n=1 Tax=uncultured Cohaesibacter sp. TaxID=1002546 RepID=UPI002AAA691F|nr:hypothetical protein [uncultured Cohaesibacter sp.]